MTCNAFLAVFVWFLIPETKKVPLEEMDTLFGGTSHVQGGAAMLHEQKLELQEIERDGERNEEVEHAATAPAHGQTPAKV